MKTLRGNNSLRGNNYNNIATFSNNNELLRSPSKKSYLDMISHNIFENRQTLNNPKEFYMDFFTNLVQKKMNMMKKVVKNKKETSKRKSGENSKNRIRNNNYLFNNNDKEEIRKKRIIKRPSTPKEVVKKGIGLLP